MLAVVAVYAVVSLALGESAKNPTTEGAGDFLQSDPAPPTYQPSALFPVYTEDAPSRIPKVVITGEPASMSATGLVSANEILGHVGSNPTPRGHYFLPEHDPLWAYVLDPGFTIPKPGPPPPAPVQAAQGALSEGELNAILQAAGWPEHLWGEAKQIAWCESRWRPDAVGDGGNSLGMFQLWFGWFSKAGYSSDQYADPLVNATVARYVYEVRGRWGGGGGWSCAALVGLH